MPPLFNVPTAESIPPIPEELLARAATANPVNTTDGQIVSVMADKAGRVVMTEAHIRELCKSQQTTISASTAETTIVSAGAGVFNDLTGLIITCTGNTVIGTLTLRDGTGGTTKAVIDYPNAASAPTTPIIIDFTPPLSQNSANANWTLQASANAGSYKVVAQYIQNT